MLELRLELHDARAELPERSMTASECLVISEYGFIGNVPFSKKHGAFNAYDDEKEAKNAISPVFWAEIPKAIGNMRPLEHKSEVV